MSFKISLAAARVNARIKQGDAAKAIGVLPQTLRNWENGKTLPKATQVTKICELYNISSDRIFFGN